MHDGRPSLSPRRRGTDDRSPNVNPSLRHMNITISHDFREESIEAKARWFQSLSVEERMEMLCAFTELILSNNPDIVDKKDAPSAPGRVRVLEQP